MKRFLREPLLHFLVIGGLLFAAYSKWGGGGNGGGGDRVAPVSNEVVITAAQVRHLAASFEKVWQRAPKADELQGLINDQTRDEVLVREALSLGLDQDDAVIRRRLRQKLEVMQDEMFQPEPPSDAELDQFLKENFAWFAQDAEYSFHHVYFNADKRGEAVSADAQTALTGLRTGGEAVEPGSLGDSFMLGQDFEAASTTFVGRMFGSEFARKLRSLKVGVWDGPVSSGYGLHLVKISAVKEGRLPALAEVRDAVLAEWTQRKRVGANETYYQSLLQKYSVRVEPLGGEQEEAR